MFQVGFGAPNAGAGDTYVIVLCALSVGGTAM